MPKRILFLKITKDYDGLLENITSVSELFGFEITIHKFATFDALNTYLSEANGSVFDIIYVAAHSNENFLAVTPNGDNALSWIDFADSLCGCPRLSSTTKVYLGCCFGGSRRIATTLMSNCDMIGSVAGAPCTLSTIQAPLAFHSYLFLSWQALDDETLSSAIGSVIRSSFKVHTRHEMDTELAMSKYLQWSEFGQHLFPASMIRTVEDNKVLGDLEIDEPDSSQGADE